MTDRVRAISDGANFTKTERAIFLLLAERANASVLRAELLAATKGGAPHTIDSHIMAIRRKLEKSGAAAKIETIVGQGFVLQI
jgi:DNA-binding response OmpR family regulator